MEGLVGGQSAHQGQLEGQVAGWSLPHGSSEELTPEEQRCMEKEQVWWPGTGSCHSLLTQGPCGEEEWLVVEQGGARVVCSPRPCPCSPGAPELCEVEVEGPPDPRGRWGRCRVASAAAQEGLCQAGEQLLVNPYGLGECGCITSPPHAVYPEDGRCYPVYSQGPCQPNFIFKISKSHMEPTCTPGHLPDTCPQGHIHDSAPCAAIPGSGPASCTDMPAGGSCNMLGSRGPCGEQEVLGLDPDTLDGTCVLNTSKTKRVYDIIPSSGSVRGRTIPNRLKMGNCRLDSNGKCRKSFFVRRGRSLALGPARHRGEELYIRKKSPRQYLRWLRAFRAQD